MPTPLSWPLTTKATPNSGGATALAGVSAATSSSRAFKLDASGDLAIVGGKLQLTSGLESIAQHVAQKLRLFRGEWPFDLEAGFPYQEVVFVKRPSLPLIRSLVRQTILEVPGVLSVTEITLTMDAKSRTATGHYSAVTDLGLLERQAISIP